MRKAVNVKERCVFLIRRDWGLKFLVDCGRVFQNKVKEFLWIIPRRTLVGG